MKKIYFTLTVKIALFILFSSVCMNVSAQTARVQIMNISADTTLDSIDVWLDNVKMDSNIVVGKMRPIITIPAGSHDITFSRKHSTDTANNVLDKSKGIPFTSGITALGIACGIKGDTSKYAPNPDGIDRTFTTKGTFAYRDTALVSSMVDIIFFNGSLDAPSFDVNVISTPKSKIADNESYALASFNYVSLTPGKYLVTLTNKDSNVFYSTYLLDITGQAGKAAILYTSGVYNKVGNPASAKSFKLYLGYGNGTVKEIKPLNSTIQIVHNSAEYAYDSVDVYINDSPTKTTLGFRKATPFLNIPPYTPYKISIATKNSTSSASAFYTTNLIADSSTGYYAVASGVKNPLDANNKPNPNGKSTAFSVSVFKGARATSVFPTNVDLLYFHGATDLMTTTMANYNASMFISKNDIYSNFHFLYSYNPNLDNLAFELKNAATDTILLKNVVGNISKKSGVAGLIFTSGFYKNLLRDTINDFPVDNSTTPHTAKLTSSQLARTLGLYIAWPDGSIDTIQTAKPAVGINEVNVLNQFSANFYPNPASDKLNISFEIDNTNMVYAELFDINGKLISLTPKANKQAGINSISLDLNEMVNGIYFCKLTIGDQKIIRRISVVR